MDIRILPSNIANMIAAGEVVQRPASVVKELVENAVDAGADQVTVVIRDAGRTLIQVIDNGCGMSPDEAVLCFERHATSKIATAEDLMDITTFGFRGEALASIAAVAEVTLRTRREEDEVGCEVRFADSIHQATDVVSAPKGANFAIRNLFYNVPARRKFMKSDNVEFRHIVEEFTRVALTRHDIGFTLVHNDKDIMVLKPAISLKFRIQNVLGSRVANEIVDINADTSVVRLSGFIGRPDMAKKGLGNQFFFVNGRYFRSSYLHKAVMKAYENLVPQGVTPSYFIYLEVDPHAVDVNIHPTKTEIKFEDDAVIFQTLFACIRQTLGQNTYDSIDFDRKDVPEIPVFTKNMEEFRPIEEPQIGLDPMYNPFENDGFPGEPLGGNSALMSAASAMAGAVHPGFSESCCPSVSPMPQMPSMPDSMIPQMHGAMTPDSAMPHEGFGGLGMDFQDEPYQAYSARAGEMSGHVSRSENYGKLFEDRTMPSKSVIVLQNRYILTSVPSGLMTINVRRARERILYERFLAALSSNSHITQTTLFPVTVQVGVENMLLFQEHADMLASLGFDISPFGTDTIVVNGVPEGYSAEPGKVQTMVSDLVVALADDHVSLPGTMMSAMAERFARLGAYSDSPVASTIEAQRLIDALFACENAEYTSSGHRIMTIIPTEDFDKKF
ncbi:MAG: DNA mismatch repair endonuclease MutL [Clostridium sp.]|nr:DNA mismatch repair endonuclease MutL [Bacteroides sp.]MCM1197395.1 DNA mismatch repair endonuclease MutL [Clostridium sp.]